MNVDAIQFDKDVAEAIAEKIRSAEFLSRVDKVMGGRMSPEALPENARALTQSVAAIITGMLEGRALREVEVAERLGVSVKTLQNARWQKKGPPYFHPMGSGSRAVRYDALALEAWIHQNQVEE